MESGWNSEQLVAEMGWVRRLARALLRDAAAADEVAQDTYLVASEHPPTEERPLRPWLARVVLNLVRTRRRSDVRRGLREAASEEARSVPSPDQLVERVQLQRAVADEVLALSEPYRSTVLLHFVEGLSSAEIARRLGIPGGTVRRRLKTALDQLRESLRKRENPPRGGWMVALAALPESRVLGVFAMKKLVAALVLIAAVVLGVTWWRGRDGSAPAAAQSGNIVVRDLTAAEASKKLAPVPAWAAQPEAPPRRIAGMVTAEGVPVPGALVRLGLAVDGELLQPVGEVTSNAEGKFDFGMQPAALFAVSASAPNHSAISVAVANADPHAKPDQLVIELGDCRSKLFGSVSDASGGAIAHARLTTAGLSGAETDTTGRYTMCLAPEDNPGTPKSTVRVEADGYGTVTEAVILAGELRHDFVLVPEAVLVGRVVTTGDQPVPGARVIAHADAAEGPHHVANGWTAADADGKFRISGLAPGKFLLTASASQVGMGAPMPAIARPATTSHELKLVLAATARVRGRVVLAGEPVAGAKVAALRAGRPIGGSSMSQPDGTFTLDGVPFGTVALAAEPYGVQTPKALEIARASVDNVVIDVGRMGTVRGHVTRKGQPVVGADIDIFQPPRVEKRVKTDPNGNYLVEGLPAGDLRYYAWDVRQKAFSQDRPLRLAAGEDKTLDIELDRAGQVLGTVVDEAGAAVAGVYIRMDDGTADMCEAISDAGGNFDCNTLAGGEYNATVAPSPGSRVPFQPATGTRFDPITVPKDGTVTSVRLAIKHERLAIRGRVVDDTGAVVPDVHVEAIAQGPGGMDFPDAMSDAAGNFEIGNLARGTYSLHAHAADGSETELYKIPSGGDPVTITLARPGAIVGTLVGFSSTPTVDAATLTNDLHLGGPAVVEGNTFTAIGLPPGHYTVEAHAGIETDGTTVDVRSGETAHVVLKSRGSGRVEGRVLELGTATPVPGMQCSGNLSMGGQMGTQPDDTHQTSTDPSGHFSLPAPTGHVRVFCFMGTPGPLSVAGTDLDVAAGGATNTEVYSVRATFGTAPTDPGFQIRPLVLPLTVNTVSTAAGLMPGDHLISIDGQSLQGLLPQGASYLLWNHKPGSPITLVIERGGAMKTVKLVAR